MKQIKHTIKNDKTDERLEIEVEKTKNGKIEAEITVTTNGRTT